MVQQLILQSHVQTVQVVRVGCHLNIAAPQMYNVLPTAM